MCIRDSAYIEAGADGFFFAQRYSNADILSEQEFERFCRPYDEMLLARAHGRTWFNMVHVHGAKNFFWDQFKTYDVQALSWENTPQQIPEEERSTVAKVRAVTDKILITGTDQFHDFYGNVRRCWTVSAAGWSGRRRNPGTTA